MLKWILAALLAVLLAILCALLIGFSGVPKQAPDVFDIVDWRARVAASPMEERPTELHWLEVAHTVVPNYALQAGNFSGKSGLSYNAFQIAGPDMNIIIGGAFDADTAKVMLRDNRESGFDQAAYDTLTGAMLGADHVLMTHEHPDHIMAIARHPKPDALAPLLTLNAAQIATLPDYIEGELPAAYKSLPTRLSGEVQTLAPGVVVAPAAGHSPGSIVIFISQQDGTEFLLVGDVVWHMMNVADLKTRPILTQLLIFNWGEDRSAVKRQVRALHDLQEANPGLIILPSHDRGTIKAYTVDGTVKMGFVEG